MSLSPLPLPNVIGISNRLSFGLHRHGDFSPIILQLKSLKHMFLCCLTSHHKNQAETFHCKYHWLKWILRTESDYQCHMADHPCVYHWAFRIPHRGHLHWSLPLLYLEVDFPHLQWQGECTSSSWTRKFRGHKHTHVRSFYLRIDDLNLIILNGRVNWSQALMNLMPKPYFLVSATASCPVCSLSASSWVPQSRSLGTLHFNRFFFVEAQSFQVYFLPLKGKVSNLEQMSHNLVSNFDDVCMCDFNDCSPPRRCCSPQSPHKNILRKFRLEIFESGE